MIYNKFKPKNSFRLFIIILVFHFSALSQEIGFPFIRNYPPNEYHNSTQILAIAQDSKGVMYFGTNNGILEYDGKKWKALNTLNKIPVYSLAIDSHDLIYAGANNDFGYLQINDRGEKEFKSLRHLIQKQDMKFGGVFQIKFSSGKIYFWTAVAIFEYSPSPQPKIKIHEAQPGNRMSGVTTHEGKVYANENNRGLVRIEGDSLKLVSSFYRDKPFNNALSVSKDTLFVVTRTNGLFFLNPFTDSSISLPLQQSDFLSNNDIYSAALLPNQTIALGSIIKGIVTISKDGQVLQTWNDKRLLQNNTVICLKNSNNQNLWLGLGNGISRTETNLSWSYWDKNTGLNGNVRDVLRFKNRIYIAAGNNIYYLMNNQPQEVKGIVAGQCWDLMEYTTPENKKILLAGTQNGIYEIIDDQARLVRAGSHALKLYASPGNPNRIYSSDLTNMVSLLYQNGKWKDEGKWNGINGFLFAITEDKNGDIWLGTSDSGVIRVKLNYSDITNPQQIVSYQVKDGLPSLQMVFPYVINNTIVFGTEKGLYVHNQQTDRFEPYCEIDQRLCDGSHNIFGVYEFPDNRIYVLQYKDGNQDLGFFKPSENGGYTWIYKPFRRIPQMTLNCFLKDENGVVWIGGGEGLFRYDEKLDPKNYDADFYTLIRKVTVGRDSVAYSGTPVNAKANEEGIKKLEYRYNQLKFEFSAPFFDEEDKTLYSYQLEGFNPDWSAWSSEGNAVYTNLFEGNYTFKVKAKNIYDKESFVATYHVNILPPWFRTWLAYCIYAVMLILAIIGIVKWNTQRLRKNQEQLERIVMDRTAEIGRKNAELKMQNEKIKSQRDEIKTQLDINVLKSEEIKRKNNELVELNATKDKFFSIIAHDLRNPFSSFLGLTQIMAEDLESLSMEEIQDIAVSMKNSASSLSSLLENLLQWARIQQGSIPFRPEVVQVGSLTNQIIATMTESAKIKEIDFLYDIPENTEVIADSNMLHTVIRNLVSNAVKFTPKGGKITVSAKSGPGNPVEISIRDTGIGMNKKLISNLFRLDVNTSRLGTEGEPSTGLGLILCREFVEKQGGKLRVESEAGIGTTFSLTLPGRDNAEKNETVEV